MNEKNKYFIKSNDASYEFSEVLGNIRDQSLISALPSASTNLLLLHLPVRILPSLDQAVNIRKTLIVLWSLLLQSKSTVDF